MQQTVKERGSGSPSPILFSWSGGKDSALALARVLSDASLRVVGLLTTVTSGYDRVSIHGVRRALLRSQADALGLPLHEIVIEPASSNDMYEAAWTAALETLPTVMADADRIAFGDIFLEDVRTYRESMMRSFGFDSVFPLWGESTTSLAQEMISSELAARVVCVDTSVLDASFAGRSYDAAFLAELPPHVDPCGERGEFHTFVSAAPGFRFTIAYDVGETVLREERFAYCDLAPLE